MKALWRNSTLRRLLFILLFFGFLLVCGGIVYGCYTFIEYYSEKVEGCCCQSISLADLSIILITLGLGILSLVFSIRGMIRDNADINRKNSENTEKALKDFHDLVSLPDYLFVKTIIDEFSSNNNYSDLMNECVKSFKNTSNIRFALKKFYVNLGKKRFGDKLSKDILEIISKNKTYVSKNDLNNDDDLFSMFEISLRRVLFGFEDLAYQYVNAKNDNEVFKASILPTIREIYLKSIVLADLFGLTNDLIYTAFAITFFENENDATTLGI